MTLAYMSKVSPCFGEPAHISVTIVGPRDNLWRPLASEVVYVCNESDCCCDPWEDAESIAQQMVKELGFRFTREEPFWDTHVEQVKALQD